MFVCALSLSLYYLSLHLALHPFFSFLIPLWVYKTPSKRAKRKKWGGEKWNWALRILPRRLFASMIVWFNRKGPIAHCWQHTRAHIMNIKVLYMCTITYINITASSSMATQNRAKKKQQQQHFFLHVLIECKQTMFAEAEIITKRKH